jgi:hypothetical protein
LCPVEATRRAGVIHEDVDAAEFTEGVRDDLLHLAGRSDVGNGRHHTAAALPDLVGDRFDAAPGARLQRGRHAKPGRDDVGQDEIGAFIGEPHGDRAPEAVLTTRTGHHGDLAR